MFLTAPVSTSVTLDKRIKIFIADHHGFVGAAIKAELEKAGYDNVFCNAVSLTDADAVANCFAGGAPDWVFLVGGKTGGISANQKLPAQLMLDNLLIDCHVMSAALRHGVSKLLYLASSCIYPKFCQQPMPVDALMTGKLEPTNVAYATAKLAGLQLCQAIRRQYGREFVAVIPSNIYGPGDDFSEEDSHVVGALMRRMHRAKLADEPEVVVWGSGTPRREFIYACDLASACLFIMDRYHGDDPINAGVGCDWSIRDLAETIKKVVGYRGALRFDSTKPDGMPAKLLDSRPLLSLGWRPTTSIQQGLSETYMWYLRQLEDGAARQSDRAFL
jgi:GDP-L-fucose synthase